MKRPFPSPRKFRACEILGLDPLYVANEGKLLAIVSPGETGRVLSAMKSHPLASEASVHRRG